MRLTSVPDLDLPGGPLRSLALTVGEDLRPLPVSFDQGRHVGLGQRPGSWMAVAVVLPHAVTTDQLTAAWLAVVARHGTLRTVFTPGDDGSVRLHEVQVLPGRWLEHEVPDGQRPRDVLRVVLDEACAPYARPSHRLVVAGGDSDHPTLVVGLDHAHTDAWSLLVLARDLMTCLDDVLAGREPGAALAPVDAFADHSALLESMPPAPEEVRRRWAEILAAGGGSMPTFPLPLGDVSTPQPDVVEVRDVLDEVELARFDEVVQQRGHRMFSVAVSVLTRVSAEMAGVPLRAVLPVHSRLEDRWHDSVGWFITNAVIESRDPDPTACAGAVREAIRLGSHPLGPIMAPYGGMPAGPGMFAISWLDNRRLPVTVDRALRPRHVSAVIRTDGVMIWFVINDSGLHLRCRSPDTPEAHVSVPAWLNAVCSGLRDQLTLP
ncbi:MAG: condensation domain-containing protein [Terracoccus sp.]